MFLTIECPDELFAEMPIPGVMTSPGAALEAVEDVPAGPWGRSGVALRLGTALSLVPRSHRRPNVAAATPLAPDETGA